jgi:cytochrome c551/c552
MTTAAHRHRPVRLLAVASGGLILILALAAAASPSSTRGAAAGTPAAAGARAAASGDTWGTAQQVPGTAALNKGGDAEITSVSCARAGNCSAGGHYADASRRTQAFVAGEANGIWGPAEEVPGTAALNRGGDAEITSVSCGRAGNCSAGGFYQDASGHFQAFVAEEVRGVWGKAQRVPGTAALNRGGDAGVFSVSCAKAGGCSAGGDYRDASGRPHAFVAGEEKGAWGQAQQVPGSAALNKGGFAVTDSVSCASAGNCSAGGRYADASGRQQVFVAGEVKGVWGPAQQVPGTAALNKGGDAEIFSVSCGRAGGCSAGGFYTDGFGRPHAFVAGEAKGIWGPAEEVPGTAGLSKGGGAAIHSVSCARAGGCSAGGSYLDASGLGQVFVAREAKGIWGEAQQVPGTAALNKGGDAEITSVSCARAGGCSAGGSYLDASFHLQAFVAEEAKGIWGPAQQVPGTAALNKGGDAEITSVSCARAGNCSAGGFYTDASGRRQAFVVNET